MNTLNFDTENVSNFPLTIDRMAEAQADWQEPLKILAAMLPAGVYIVAGCEQAGDHGWICLSTNDGNEVVEVRPNAQGGSFLVYHSTHTTATNSDNEEVEVRTEHWMEWAASRPATATSIEWAIMERLQTRLAKPHDEGWTECSGGTRWTVPVGGTSLRVWRADGRTRLEGRLKYGLRIGTTVYYSGDNLPQAYAYTPGATSTDNILVLPVGYRPTGAILIPILYNGAPHFAVVDTEGQLLINIEPALGDTLVVETWIDV